MIQHGSPVNGLNQGVALARAQLQIGTKHTEANTITSLYGSETQFLGLMKLWNQYNIVNTPIFSQTELANNVIRTNGLGQTLTYMVKSKIEMPYILEDLCGDAEKVGYNREKFSIVLNTNRYTKGDVLAYDRRNGLQAVVCFDEEVEPYGTGFKYTLRISHDDPKKFIPRRFLQPFQIWFKIDHVKSEWSTENSTITTDSDGFEMLQFKTGDTLSGIEHWFTGHSDLIKVKHAPDGVNKDLLAACDPQKVAVMYAFETLGDPNDPGNPDRVKKAIPGSGRWMPMILELMNREVAKMIENKLTWSTGGVVYDARNTMIRRGMGVYPQMKESGNYRTYSHVSQLLQILKDITGDLFYGRADIPMHLRKVKFKMGMGALIEIQKAFKEEFKADNPFVVLADHPALKGYLTGDNMNLKVNGFRFVSYNFPEAGTVEIEHNPALDWVGTNTETTYYGRYPNSSYSIMVEDLTDAGFSNALSGVKYDTREGFDNGANIVLIKPAEFDQIHTAFQVGDYCPDVFRTYVGAGKNAHISSMKDFGFRVAQYWAGEAWIKDTSRIILIEREDPMNDY